MLPDLSRESLSAFTAPLEKLKADTPRKFGEMDPSRTLRHLRTALELSLGEGDAKDESIPVLRFIIRVVFFQLITRWPGGKFKAPDYWTPPAEHEFDEEKRLLCEALERFVVACEAQPDRKTISPLLGPIRLDFWSHVHAIHSNHHYRQFGLL
jgi:hypothetical protein